MIQLISTISFGVSPRLFVFVCFKNNENLKHPRSVTPLNFRGCKYTKKWSLESTKDFLFVNYELWWISIVLSDKNTIYRVMAVWKSVGKQYLLGIGREFDNLQMCIYLVRTLPSRANCLQIHERIIIKRELIWCYLQYVNVTQRYQYLAVSHILRLLIVKWSSTSGWHKWRRCCGAWKKIQDAASRLKAINVQHRKLKNAKLLHKVLQNENQNYSSCENYRWCSLHKHTFEAASDHVWNWLYLF